MVGIYKITSPSDKIYIGQSTNIEKRFIDYFYLNCKNQTRLYNSLKKHSVENHKFEIIETCEESQLLERETYWKNFYKVLEVPSLCCRIDGKGGRNSKETNLKISNSKQGQKMTKESSLKKRDRMLGKTKHTKESKKLIGDKNRHPKSQDFKEKLRKPKTLLHRQNLSLSKCKMPIIRYDLQMLYIDEWLSGAHASRALNIAQSSISAACRNKLSQAGGYIWKYKLLNN